MVVRGSALCILAPLLVPEVTIPEQKMSKGKGTKMGAKEKRSILLESEVSGPQECASQPSLLRQGTLVNLHCGGDTRSSPPSLPCLGEAPLRTCCPTEAVFSKALSSPAALHHLASAQGWGVFYPLGTP